MSGFAFAWLELISHRSFLPKPLQLKGQKGWNLAHQLLVDLILFLEPYLRRTELTPSIEKLYEGTLRVLLTLLLDFPSFLAAYHLSLCDVIPENCVQLRNLVLSAVPRGMVLPDPFAPNLKIDLLPEILQSPVILSNVLGPLEAIWSDLDAHLKDRQWHSQCPRCSLEMTDDDARGNEEDGSQNATSAASLELPKPGYLTKSDSGALRRSSARQITSCSMEVLNWWKRTLLIATCP